MATTVLGFGFAPLGTSPAGFGVPASSDAPGVPAIGTGRYIDPTTRDFAMDTTTPGATGSLRRMKTVPQLVYLAILTELDSSAVRNLGRTALPRLITTRTREELLASAQRALASLITQGLVELVDVTNTVVAPGRIQEQLRWRDLTDNTEHLTTI